MGWGQRGAAGRRELSTANLFWLNPQQQKNYIVLTSVIKDGWS